VPLSGLLFANPIPEESAIPKAEMDLFIHQAVEAASQSAASGKDNTPFILKEIYSLSGGRSLVANRALIKSNVLRGVEVAKELALLDTSDAHSSPSRDTSSVMNPPTSVAQELQEKDSGTPTSPNLAAACFSSDNFTSSQPRLSSDRHVSLTHHESKNEPDLGEPKIIVAGSIAVDTTCDYLPPSQSPDAIQPALHTSNPAQISQTIGGVGRNVALAAHYLGVRSELFSLVGDDAAGRLALTSLKSADMGTGGVFTVPQISGLRTAQYVSVNNARKDLEVGMADMDIFEKGAGDHLHLWKDRLHLGIPHDTHARKRHVFVVDANWHPNQLLHLLSKAVESHYYTAYEPVSAAKAPRIFQSLSSSSNVGVFPKNPIDLVCPNVAELDAMYAYAESAGLFDATAWKAVMASLDVIPKDLQEHLKTFLPDELVEQQLVQRCMHLMPYFHTILLTLGSNGILRVQSLSRNGLEKAIKQDSLPSYCIVAKTAGAETRYWRALLVQHIPAPRVLRGDAILSVNGAGDTFLGAYLALLIKRTKENRKTTTEKLVEGAQEAAILTLQSKEAVSRDLKNLNTLVNSLAE